MELNSIEEIIDDIRLGKMVVLMDDEDRENEGDLIIAAEKVRPEDINFMAKYARGLICLTLTQDHCEHLRLPLMVNDNNAQFSTNFTVSIEAAEGVTTGISAADRARTVQAAVAKDVQAEDIVQPGHIFPLKAQQGGVLSRAGHTEAGCDLARLAGCSPASAIVEIMNEDGTMARRPDLEEFAKEHGLKIGTIADLIHYRILHEKTVERIEEYDLQTEHGEFQLKVYRDNIENDVHLAFVKGDINAAESVLVRVHVADTLRDLIATKRLDGNESWSLNKALVKISEEGQGVVVLIANSESSDSLLDNIHSLLAPEKKRKANIKEGGSGYSVVGTGSQILRDLGVRKMRLLSSPKKFNAISGFDLEVVEYVECG